jgi:hypothetical protein
VQLGGWIGKKESRKQPLRKSGNKLRELNHPRKNHSREGLQNLGMKNGHLPPSTPTKTAKAIATAGASKCAA